ncbi:uncharacterized protein NMK_1857 [Novimethylophilus kurashikiensis]|uniref:Uncharacterized protein n=1 Tax=Novimethylophilus kurashikiensis TaxID=1825523 RepID=A0A2R5FC60_9PROT|nr:hypothetical protein [Novimethylophilus kurashikiensis]GBG14291.1 uncharacterized protein NMK_1857 [Novimethylophilus kurashikiensis]
MNVTITAANMNDLASRIAACANTMGFQKNGKPMVASQGLKLMAALAGYREEHSLVAALKAEKPTLGEPDQDVVLQRQEMAKAPSLLAAEHSVETAKALLLGKLGYSVYPDADQPGMWVWKNGSDGCEASFNSMDEAISDVWTIAADKVARIKGLTGHDWANLSLVEQMQLIEETLVVESENGSYSERSFELGAMSRDALLDVLEAGDYPSHVYDWTSDDIRGVILEAEFPEVSTENYDAGMAKAADTSMYVIYSAAEAEEGAGFWNQTNGWTELSEATPFSASIKNATSSAKVFLPITAKQDAKWVSLAEAAKLNQKSPMDEAIEELQQRWYEEHGFYTRSDWKEEVARGDTKLGYWEWVVHAIEANDGDESHCAQCGKPLDDGEGWDGKCGNCADHTEHLTELAETLGINLEDAKFWVKTHYAADFDDSLEDEQEAWLHSYRQYNGLTPADSKANQSIDALRKVADAAYESYDFGENLVVEGDSGWEWTTGETVLSKAVFLGDIRTPELPSTRKVFVVNVVNGIAQDIHVRD